MRMQSARTRYVRAALSATLAAAAVSACSESAIAPIEHVTAVTLQAPNDSLFLGRTMRLMAAATGDSTIGASPRFIWTSSDTNVVVVDSLGTALGLGVGIAIVRAELQGQRAQRSVRIVLARADAGVTFTDGSANDSRSCALASGVVYCRSASTATDSTPLMVRMRGGAGLSFTAVEGSLHAACALNTDGRIMCWGNNAHYLFARAGTVVADTGPVAVSTTRRFSAFSHGGHAQTCGVDRADSGVYCWGHNDFYQLGRGFVSAQDSIPTAVGGNLRGSMVSTVNFSTCMLDVLGAAFCAGGANATRFRLGIDETFLPAEVPLPVTGTLTFKNLSAGDSGACAISKSDDAYCWGLNSSGQLGIGTTVNPPASPQRVLGGLKFGLLTTVYRSSTCGITLDGDLYCWGQFVPFSISSRLGERALRPHHLIKGVKFKSLTRNVSAAICGVTTDGRVYCWN